MIWQSTLLYIAILPALLVRCSTCSTCSNRTFHHISSPGCCFYQSDAGPCPIGDCVLKIHCFLYVHKNIAAQQCMYLLSAWIDLYSKYIHSWISIHTYIYIYIYIYFEIHRFDYSLPDCQIIHIHINTYIQYYTMLIFKREIIIWICRPRKRWSCKKSGKGRNGRLQSFVWEP